MPIDGLPPSDHADASASSTKASVNALAVPSVWALVPLPAEAVASLAMLVEVFTHA